MASRSSSQSAGLGGSSLPLLIEVLLPLQVGGTLINHTVFPKVTSTKIALGLSPCTARRGDAAGCLPAGGGRCRSRKSTGLQWEGGGRSQRLQSGRGRTGFLYFCSLKEVQVLAAV